MSSVEPGRQRLFFALWPDPATRQAVSRLADRAAKRCGGRRIQPECLHLTLAFLGPVEANQKACLEAGADRVTAGPFDLVLDRLGYFERPRVLWVGSRAPHPTLLALVSHLREGMAACGLVPDPRPFRPHLTLRRHAFRGPATGDELSVGWHVDEFVLVRSHTEAAGARYEILRRWPL